MQLCIIADMQRKAQMLSTIVRILLVASWILILLVLSVSVAYHSVVTLGF